jgi:hypothetical protein
MIAFAQFLRDPALSGEEWQKPTRWPWHALAKAMSGERLTGRDLRLVRSCTGLRRVPRNPRVLVALIGRRGGKSAFLAAFAVWVALFAQDWRAVLSRGERAVVLLLATDKKQAAILSRYAAGLCQGDLIAPEVVRLTADEIEFASGAVLEVGVSDFRAIRGRTCAAVIIDEAAFHADEGASPLEEVIVAAEPSLATIPGGGWLLLSSSPWKPRGVLHKRWRELHGQQANADSIGAMCWVAPSRTMNPSLSKAYVDRKVAEDPVRARCEYLVDPASPWRSTDADFVPEDAIQGCTEYGVRERPPQPGRAYYAHVDLAGGSGEDSAAIAISSADRDGTVRLDLLRERKPRFVPGAVVAEFADLLRAYGLHAAHGDAWAGGLQRQEWSRNGIELKAAKRTTSEAYLAGLPLLLNGRARLLDNTTLRSQLAGLERRATSGHREVVTHGHGKHDDVACAAMGALVLAAEPTAAGFVWSIDGEMFDASGAVVAAPEPEPATEAEILARLEAAQPTGISARNIDPWKWGYGA